MIKPLSNNNSNNSNNSNNNNNSINLTHSSQSPLISSSPSLLLSSSPLSSSPSLLASSPSSSRARSLSQTTRPIPSSQLSSIITSIFGGSLESRLRCNTCGYESIKLDPYYDLSLPIPEKPGIWNTLLSATGIMSDSVDLLECFTVFTQSEILAGDEQVKCERCSHLTDATKSISLHTTPEILVVQLKRFRYDSLWSSKIRTTVRFPETNFDISSFVRGSKPGSHLYNLIGFVSHSGGLSGGHYIAYARHLARGQWFRYDDSTVTPVDSQQALSNEAYIIFYQKTQAQSSPRSNDKMNLLLRSNPSLAQTDLRAISVPWIFRYQHFQNPGPISNCDWICPHNKLLAGKVPHMSSHVCFIPVSAWQKLHSMYGGGPEISEVLPCDECEKQRAEEKATVSRLDQIPDPNDPSTVWYLIHSAWIAQWRQHVKPFSTIPPPGPISNHELVRYTSPTEFTPRPGLRRVDHYRGINAQLWNFFVGKYGGGPPIIRKNKIDLYSRV